VIALRERLRKNEGGGRADYLRLSSA